MPRVSVKVDNEGVADVRLNRPEKLNALDGAMIAALVDVGEELKASRALRAVVLSGEGKAFCAGIDLVAFQAGSSGQDAGTGRSSANDATSLQAIADTAGGETHLGQKAAWVWTELPVPVIAAVHGACLGGGLQIALGADVRYVHRNAQLSIMEVKWGLTPDMTATLTLPDLMPLDVVRELVYTARVLSGTKAVEIGLATHLADDPRAAAMILAHEIAGRSPDAVRAAKELLRGSLRRGRADQLALERSSMASLLGSPNQREAVISGLAKRRPHFADPVDV